MPKTVLLADDSITIQKVVGISFASEDVKLVSVDNGEAAVAKARELRPDLVLADVVMPGLSGYEVCEALKQDPALRHIPVLLLTGTFEAFDEERARRAGAAGHVAKPFEAQTLVEQVKRLLAAPAARPAAVPPAAPARPAEKPAAAARAGAEPSRAMPAATAARPGAPAAPRPTPTPAPRPAAAPAPQSAAQRSRPAPAPSAEDSFDFFEEPAGDLSQEPVFEASAQPGALPFGDANEAFSFGDDDFGSVEAESAPAWSPPARRAGRASDATVAILPAPEPARRRGSGRELVLEAEPEEAGGDARGLATLAAELLDEDTGPVASANAFAPDARAEARFGSARRELAGHVTELFDVEATEVGRAAPRLPVEDSDLARAALLDPGRATGFDVSASDLDEPAAAPPKRVPTPAPAGRAAPEARGPRAGSPSSAGAAAAAAELVRELTPRLREPLHDTLEKIAWESFGSMAEEIVKRAVERMEAVAWEVIPQMAETLIREELRRIKGEGEDPEY